MSAATVLRKTAALMRERAEAATPGPWCFYNEDLWEGTVERLQAFDDDPENVPWPYESGNHPAFGTLFHGDPGRPEDAQHIAGWHPDVALPVADWLDSVATALEHGGDERALWLPEALAVARAYLGGDP